MLDGTLVTSDVNRSNFDYLSQSCLVSMTDVCNKQCPSQVCTNPKLSIWHNSCMCVFLHFKVTVLSSKTVQLDNIVISRGYCVKYCLIVFQNELRRAVIL